MELRWNIALHLTTIKQFDIDLNKRDKHKNKLQLNIQRKKNYYPSTGAGPSRNSHPLNSVSKMSAFPSALPAP